MNYLLLTTIISSIGCVALGGYALKYDFKNLENRYFALFCLVTALWLIFYYISLSFTLSMLLVNITMFLATIQTMALFLFVNNYSIFSINKKWIYIYTIYGIFVALFTFSPYVFSHIENINGTFLPIPGWGMILFAVFSLGSVMTSFTILILNINKVDRINRVRTIYILVGFVLTMMSIIISNFFGVILFHSLYLSPHGMMSVLFFISFTAFAMTRYRFLEVKVAIKKSLVYGISLLIITFIYFAIVLSIFFAVFYTAASTVLIIYSASAAALYIFLFQYFSKRIKRSLDGMFFKEEIDIIKIVDEEKRVLNTTHELDSFVLKLAGSIQEVIYAPVKRIFIIQERYKKYQAFFPQGSRDTIFFDDAVLGDIKNLDKAILLDELKETENTTHLEKMMKKYNTHIFMPVKLNQEILAIIFIGPHKNAQPFKSQDLEVLEEFQKTAQQSIPSLLYWQETIENLREHLKNQ